MPRKRKADNTSRIMRALGILALSLGVVTIALFAVQYSRGVAAEKNAEKLLIAYQAKPTPTPGPSLSPSVSPAVSGTPAPAGTPDPASQAAADDANEHRVDDGSDAGVDESGNYQQPDAPEHDDELTELMKKISASEGEDGVIGLIEIPEIGLTGEKTLPIIGKWSYKLLKLSICRYKGPLPNHEGNLVLLGHNYKSGAHFGNLDKLKKGSEVFLTDSATGTRLRYEVYEIKSVNPDAFSEIKPYEGDCGLTLLTCMSNGDKRQIFRCVQKDAEPTPTPSTTQAG